MEGKAAVCLALAMALAATPTARCQQVRITHPAHGEWVAAKGAAVHFTVTGLADHPFFTNLHVHTGEWETFALVNQEDRFALDRCVRTGGGGRVVVVDVVSWETGEVLATGKVGFFVEDDAPHSRHEASDQAVHAHYTQHPYPRSGPLESPDQLDVDGLTLLLLLNHYLFKGALDWGAPGLRILFAGGSIGDEAIAIDLALRQLGNTDAHITVFDVSQHALDVGRQSARNLNAERVEFVEGSLLSPRDVAKLGVFDVVVCTGVLHHLSSPDQGLRALTTLLKPGGGMHLMVYGDVGRAGIYDLQEVARLANVQDEQRALDLVTRLVNVLPEDARLKQAPSTLTQIKSIAQASSAQHHATRHGSMAGSIDGTTELVDVLLHPRDVPFGVTDVYRLCDKAQMRVTGFWKNAQYDFGLHTKDEEVLRALDALPTPQRMRIGELLVGNINRHLFFALPASATATNGEAPWDDWALVPTWTSVGIQRQVLKSPNLRVNLNGRAVSMPFPGYGREMARHIDGRNTLRQVYELWTQKYGDFSEAQFLERWELVGRTLRGLDWVVMCAPGSGLLSLVDLAAAPSLPTESGDELAALVEWLKERPVLWLLGAVVATQAVHFVATRVRIRPRPKPKTK